MAITVSGGATVGNQGHGATVKPYGFARVQFDTSGTYATGGIPNWQTFIRTVLGTKVTMVDCIMVLPGGAFYLYWDQVNDKLLIYVGATGIELAAGQTPNLANAEVLVIFE